MKQSFFDINLPSIFKSNHFVMKTIYDQLLATTTTVVEEGEGENKCVYFYDNNEKYTLSNQRIRNQMHESMMRKLDFNKDSIFIVHGMGDGSYLKELYSLKSEVSRIVILEPNIDIIKYAMHETDLTEVFSQPNVHIFSGDEDTLDTIIIALFGLNLYYNLVHNIQEIIHPNYYRIHTDYLKFVKKVKERVFTALIGIGNSLEDTFVGFDNSYMNYEAHLQANSVLEIENKYKGLPAIIVSAGPSLDKNIHHIGKAYGKALIITTDASLDACIKHGAKPDMIASIERDEPTYTYYYKDKKIDDDIVLVGPGELWPNIYKEYPGKKMIVSRKDTGIHAWWAAFFDNVEHMNTGHSSATIAYMTAVTAGCNPIILIGQDLAFTGDKKHSNLTHTEFEGDNDSQEHDGIFVKDYDGNLIKSDLVYKMFKTWFEYQIKFSADKYEVIDATEGGAYIEGSKIMTFEAVIEKYCTQPKEKRVNDMLKEIKVTNDLKKETLTRIVSSIDQILKDLESIRKKADKHYHTLVEQENKIISYKNLTEERMVAVLKKMQGGDQIIQRILYEEPVLIPFFEQIIRQTVAHVKKIGNEIDKASVMRNIKLQANLMYIIVGSSAIIKEKFLAEQEYLQAQLDQMKGGDLNAH